MQDVSLWIPKGEPLTFVEALVVSLQLLLLCREGNCVLHSLHEKVPVSVL